MLSVIIPVVADESALIETLAALVPAVADGAIRDVSLAAPPSTGILRDLSDATGCRLVETVGPRAALVAAAAGQARCDWLLVLEPGLVPGSLWADEAADFVARSRRPETAGFTLQPARGASAALRAWAINASAGLLGRPHPDLGLIRPRDGAGSLPFTRLQSPIHDRRMGPGS
ncbi:hypothetical protein [uncultured Alsobacter sp.]|uniref:hypothetical protein n=1 Tax=uncultured Alsobacter sp. TaxID=1748258 RepID=UPI0025CC4552|nr:hypothetical protein [uncultured Alsobacter sp.]